MKRAFLLNDNPKKTLTNSSAQKHIINFCTFRRQPLVFYDRNPFKQQRMETMRFEYMQIGVTA